MRIQSAVAGFFRWGQMGRQKDAERKRQTDGQRDRELDSRQKKAWRS